MIRAISWPLKFLSRCIGIQDDNLEVAFLKKRSLFPCHFSQKRRATIAVVKVFGVERVHFFHDLRDAKFVGPSEQAFWVIHAVRHGEFDVVAAGDFLVKHVGSFVDEHH